jgi:hypothetical protein
MAIAQILGVAPLAIRVAFKENDPAGVTMILQCSSMISSWQNLSSVGLVYVNATELLYGLKSVSVAALGQDAVLGAFDWTTLVVSTAVPKVTITITSFSDSGCKNRTSEKSTVLNDLYCSFGANTAIGQVYFKAISCGAQASYGLSLNPDRCNALVVLSQDIGNCTATDDPAVWTLYTCTSQPIPPPAPPALPPNSSTASNTSLAIIVGCSVGGFVAGTYFPPLLNFAILKGGGCTRA